MTSSVERVELPGIGFRSVFSTSEGIDVVLMARGEFSIVIASLGATIEPELSASPAPIYADRGAHRSGHHSPRRD